MATLALFVVAALAFSILAGLIEIRGARRTRRRLMQQTSPVLHPLARHPLPRVRYWSRRRTLHHIVLFIGFLVAVYVGTVIVRTLYALLSQWF